MTVDDYDALTIDKAVSMYWVFNNYRPAVAFRDLPVAQQERWCGVADYVVDDRDEIREMENINTELRDELWTILLRVAARLNVTIDVDRY